jgi:Family of unknown function (DUF6311)
MSFATALTARPALAALAIALGIGNALLLLGPEPLDPRFLEWIYGDNATYYMGWALYRQDHHLSFPLAFTERIGYPVGASIAMMDAIPLLAIVLRPLSPLLSDPFQYLGLYMLLCFVLQAYFGFSLCRRLFPQSPAFILLGGCLFLLSAPMTWRVFGHVGLISHWLILAALDCYFREPGAVAWRWMARLWIVLALSLGITPYISAMCLAITAAGLGRLMVERRCGLIGAATLLAGTAIVVVASAASFGLIGGGSSSYFAPGYGLFSMNLNAPINPMAHGSLLLPERPTLGPEQVEGYNYLGLGALTLLVIGFLRRPAAIRWLGDRRLWPLVVMSVGLTAMAVSAVASLDATTLFEVRLAGPFASVAHGLRASGRLFWPVYYLLYLAGLAVVFWNWQGAARVAILIAAVGLQAADLATLRSEVRSVVNNRFPLELVNPAWRELGSKYDNLILLPAFQCSPFGVPGGLDSYVSFGKISAAARLRTNSYYAARYSEAEMRTHCIDLLRKQLAGELDPRSAYVVTEGIRVAWLLAGVTSHACVLTDGFNLCTTAAAPGPAAPPPAAHYQPGELIDFTTADSSRRYMTFGWGDHPGPIGTWTEGPLAIVRLGINQPVDAERTLILETSAYGFSAPTHLRTDVDVYANGVKVDQWVFRSPQPIPSGRRTSIPAALLAGRGGLDIELRVINPQAPVYAALEPVYLFRGINVRSMTVSIE